MLLWAGFNTTFRIERKTNDKRNTVFKRQMTYGARIRITNVLD